MGCLPRDLWRRITPAVCNWLRLQCHLGMGSLQYRAMLYVHNCRSPLQSSFLFASVCHDVPGWKSSTNVTCAMYRRNKFCVDDTYGPGWRSSYGTFADWAVDGVDASMACCGCGRGSPVPFFFEELLFPYDWWINWQTLFGEFFVVRQCGDKAKENVKKEKRCQMRIWQMFAFNDLITLFCQKK